MSHSQFMRFAKPLLLAGATVSLGGCSMTGFGLGAGGYYGDGYVNGGYACDPYDPFDSYYACDYGYGFANIGFGGGWYDHYYYPGYGRFLFDRGGHRHHMKKHHRRYWAHKRAKYGTRHGRRNGHHAGGGRDLTPEQRAERRERWRNMTPEQRAERRERRAERRDTRRGSSINGNSVTSNAPETNANRQGRGVRRNRGGNGVVRSTRVSPAPAVRRGRPTMAIEQPKRARSAVRQRPVQKARPAAARSAPAPAARPTRAPARSSHRQGPKRNID